ncbi:unnamed protein product [Cylindrotheca closterium]|uniref:Uncharacterized protein n=1 Tax=Cylindrotheca closterium TaxID=2856 RepID=A0AAD2CP66_9STRA|nr:unnamed protein product [Cylindrotheca closterium]
MGQMRKARTSRKKVRSKRRDSNWKNPASLDDILAAAESAQQAFDNEQAADQYSRAASLLRNGHTIASETRESLLIRVLEKLGECKVSLGHQSGAKADFEEAIAMLENEQGERNIRYHETRSSLFFYVGQLCMEKEALRAYQQGLGSLETCAKLGEKLSSDDAQDSPANPLHEVRAKLSGGYCTIAELYLTDLCFEDNAESECEAWLTRALELRDRDGEPFVDVLQTMASLRLSQQAKQLESAEYILRAFEKMKVGCDALASLVGLMENGDSTAVAEQALELTNVDSVNTLPEFEFRCQTAKLLLECATLVRDTPGLTESQKAAEQQCVSAAVSVLGSLLAQNDEVVEIWFLAGCAFALKNPLTVDAATYYLERAMEMLKKVREVLESNAKVCSGDQLTEVKEELEENRIQMEDVQGKIDELMSVETAMEE